MGGHNLGGASRTNSGYSGLWTTGGKARFNTQFYQNLVNADLTFDNVVSTLKYSLLLPLVDIAAYKINNL